MQPPERGRSAEAHGKELHVVLVEDNEHDAFLVRTVLQDAGINHTLQVIEDGKAAIEYVDQIGTHTPCPDLLLLDINLPRANGLEVLSHFRNHHNCEHIPVIVFSSSVAPKEQARLAELHVSRFFQKPADYDKFAQLGIIVREVTGKEEQRTPQKHEA
ncbi:MAG: response regulator [Saprospiraceae bacterium]